MIKNILSKKLLIVIIFLAGASIFYFVFKDTKKIAIKNAGMQNIQQEESDIEVTAKNKEVEDIISNTEEAEIIDAPIVTENETEEDKEKEIIEEGVGAPDIINKLVSWGYQSASNRSIDTIVIHSSYNALGNDPYDLDGLINEYKQYGVATHYLIDRKGKIYQLVQDKNIAYHAGVSSVSDGRTDVNNFSIGIELINTKTDEYTSNQYETLNELINYLKLKYSIKYTLGHDQIAPGRKDDPWNFDWNKIE
ncbi:1,6-anhydro-N-acetylmuramyl-L-alanine amidase AmpD [bacterium BMS3Abin15]|nr:1,6-anhydro-N-acetylmuramyl-L-alanine amidase AmpD [bacterium BMS3Abin15]HDZ85831.1 N-acetylmuramoyl-L-alanine amidase [Candidatus Moranbacteria bacterium]